MWDLSPSSEWGRWGFESRATASPRNVESTGLLVMSGRWLIFCYPVSTSAPEDGLCQRAEICLCLGQSQVLALWHFPLANLGKLPLHTPRAHASCALGAELPTHILRRAWVLNLGLKILLPGRTATSLSQSSIFLQMNHNTLIYGVNL